MALVRLRDQDILDGASNYGVQKAIISFLLEENDLKEYGISVVVVPTNPTQLATCKKEDAKARSVILDRVTRKVVQWA